MKIELDEKLCKDFPKIFVQRDLSPQETAMCWGFECGDGWYDLIYQLCEDIQDHCDENPNEPQVEAVQVKEKYGSLRFYVNAADDHVYSLIDKAEEDSYDICEDCGSKEDVAQTIGGWTRSLCDKCDPNR